MSELPQVKLLHAIRPQNAGEGDPYLAYENVEPSIAELTPSLAERSDLVWEAEPQSVEEAYAAKRLAMVYIIKTAGKLIETPQLGDRNLWAERFTSASVELYGAPEPKEASLLLSEEEGFVRSLKNNPKIDQNQVDLLLKTYESLPISHTGQVDRDSDSPEEREKQNTVKTVREFLLESFGPVFDVVSQSGKTIITAANMRDFFEQAFSQLAEIDGPEWRDWVANMGEGNSVNTELGEVTVGKNKKCFSV
jgi:hypothetical protein